MSFLEIKGDASKAEKLVADMAEKLTDESLFTFHEERVWPWLRQRTEQRFTREGDDAVGAWRALSRNTWTYRRDQGFPPRHPINVRTGALREFALTHETQKQGAGMTLTQPKRGGSKEVNIKLRHAQRGGTTPGGRAFQARPVVALGAVDVDHIQRNLFDWIVGGGVVT